MMSNGARGSDAQILRQALLFCSLSSGHIEMGGQVRQKQISRMLLLLSLRLIQIW